MCSICALASMTVWEQPGLPQWTFILFPLYCGFQNLRLVSKTKCFLVKSTCDSLPARTNLSQSVVCVLTVSRSRGSSGTLVEDGSLEAVQ